MKYWTYDEEGHVSFKDVSLPANLSPENMVKVKNHTHTHAGVLLHHWQRHRLEHIWHHSVFQVENINCPLLFIVGEDDLSSASEENADLVCLISPQLINHYKSLKTNNI